MTPKREREREREEQIRWGRSLLAKQQQQVMATQHGPRRSNRTDPPQQPYRTETAQDKLAALREQTRAWLRKRKETS